MKGIIFDLDGTLIDSMTMWEKVGLEYLDTRNIKYPENLIDIIKPMGFYETSEYFRGLGLNETEDEIYQGLADMAYGKYEKTIPLKPFVLEFLQDMKNKNIKMCIVTASIRSLIIPCLERLAISHFFEFILTCDEENLSKSERVIFDLAASKLGLNPSEITVFEDSLIPIKTAKNAGFNVIGVHDVTAYDEKDEIMRTCDQYIESFEELM